MRRISTVLIALTFADTPSLAVEPVGLAQMLAIERLPFLKHGVSVHYEGSIDKRGGNSDWDWGLYQEGGEWVIFDVDGPGCIYNFVQHRYPTSLEPTFKFYFDGEREPRLVAKLSEIGKKPPFIEPLAGCFTGDDPKPVGRGPIWVVRSFVPMPFARSCKVTSSVQLKGHDKAKQEGGWGHIVYHSYATAEGVATFTGKEDFTKLVAIWNGVGSDPKNAADDQKVGGSLDIPAGGKATILDRNEKASVAAIRLNIANFTEKQLLSAWIRILWDGQSQAAVDLPLGAFFGNQFGIHGLRFITHGTSDSGDSYSYFPMPYWKSARIELLNKDVVERLKLSYEIAIKPPAAFDYPAEKCGHFRASPYYPNTPARPCRDSAIAALIGNGHVVAGHIAARSERNQYVSCEGDLRVHVDGNATPQVESDGSESWCGYGWGFVAPPRNNPSSGYDGSGNPLFAFSMVRVCTGDWYPFRTALQFGIEAGNRNDGPMAHSGAVLYYGVDSPGAVLSDTLDVGDAASEAAHEYRVVGQTWHGVLKSCYEGDQDEVSLTDSGRALTGSSEFTVTVRPDNSGARLRRRCDQHTGRQRARVYVDGIRVKERTWYYADKNPHKRWLDDEFEIPAAYTQGKDRLRIKVEQASYGGSPAWNEYRYWVMSYATRG